MIRREQASNDKVTNLGPLLYPTESYRDRESVRPISRSGLPPNDARVRREAESRISPW